MKVSDFKLTPHQMERAVQVKNWWNSSQIPEGSTKNWNKGIIISSPAGCGKTAMIRETLAEIPDARPLFTATTNEAVSQLALTGAKVYGTTHSALGIRPVFTAEQSQFRQMEIPDILYDHNVLVIDEASMASMADDSKPGCYPLLLNYAIQSGLRLIMLADSYQLPPVESEDGISPCFQQGFAEVRMTEVIRNKGDVLAYCNAIRTAIDSPIKRVPAFQPSDTLKKLAPQVYMAQVKSSDPSKFISGERKILAFKNVTVDMLNKIIRERIFGDIAKQQKFIVTDNIVTTSVTSIYQKLPKTVDELPNVSNGEKILVSVNSKGEVLEISTSTIFGIECYMLKVKFQTGGVLTIPVPTESGELRMKAYKDKFMQSLTSLSGRAKEERWKVWHAFNGIFSQVKYSYALTVHRAQGSSIKEVDVLGYDIMTAARHNPLLAYKLYYTAVSRTQEICQVVL
jgi:exodeoxyribonuclease-5